MFRSALVHVQASFNNTIVTITDQMGNTLCLEEFGFAGLPRIAQGHALRGAAGSLERRQPGARSRHARVDVRVSGPGSGRESAVRALAAAGIDVRSIRDVTPVPHNGCRPPKRRRV